MDSFSLGILLAITALLILRGLLTREGMLQYPFLAGAVTAGWFVPQAIKLLDQPGLPTGGYALTMVVATMALLSILLADIRPVRIRGRSLQSSNEQALLIGAAILSLVGAIAYALILRTDASDTSNGQATGIVTIYFFLYKAQYFGLALSMIICLRRYSLTALAIVLFDLLSILTFVVFGGRRGPAAEVALITACAFWFQWRYMPPRVATIAAIGIFSVFVAGVAEYRGLVQRINADAGGADNVRLPTIQELSEIDFMGMFINPNSDTTLEASNAIHYISGAFEIGSYSLGANYWNGLIFQFVPGQFVGSDLKASLQFNLVDPALEAYGYVPNTGSTFTGFAELLHGVLLSRCNRILCYCANVALLVGRGNARLATCSVLLLRRHHDGFTWDHA